MVDRSPREGAPHGAPFFFPACPVRERELHVIFPAMSKSAKFRLTSIKERRALQERLAAAAVVPAPTPELRPVERVVLPRVTFPLRWKSWDKCALCGLRGKMTVDHIVPLSKGGWNCASNKQPLCATCNVVKGARRVRSATDYEWILLESLGRQGRTGGLPTVRE